MTDVALDGGGASAPADVSGAPIPENATPPGNALQSAGPEKEQPEQLQEKPSSTVREAIERANAKLAAKDAAAKEAPAKDQPKAEAKPAPKENAKGEAKPDDKATPDKEAQPRGDRGQFASRQSTDGEKPISTAPKWIPPERAAKWDAADPELKADIAGYNDRREREYSQGIEKYRKSAERDADLGEYHQLAESQGTSVKAALRNYVGIERMLRTDLLGGLERIVSNTGAKTADGRALTLRDVAAHIMGQTPDQNTSRQESTIADLRGQISRLEQQLGGVTQTIQQNQHSQTLSQVEAFAKSHPRFDDLSEAIQAEIKHGYSLEDAYARAELLNPAPRRASSDEPVIPAKTDPKPLNPAGSKSISGAPASGSDPDLPDNRPVPSIAEALRRGLNKARAAA